MDPLPAAPEPPAWASATKGNRAFRQDWIWHPLRPSRHSQKPCYMGIAGVLLLPRRRGKETLGQPSLSRIGSPEPKVQAAATGNLSVRVRRTNRLIDHSSCNTATQRSPVRVLLRACASSRSPTLTSLRRAHRLSINIEHYC